MWLKTSLIASSLLLLILAVSVTEKILQIPLLEVGGLWVQTAGTVTSRLLASFWTLSDLSSPWTYIKVATPGVVLYGFYIVLFRPLNRIRRLGETGYIPVGSFPVKESANLVQKRRKVGNTPPPYPNGWFGLMESFYLKVGEAKSVSALGQNLAVFRDQNRIVHVLDAYCPHMGANLAAGGRVLGDCIECPFHAWKFRGHDGKCVSILYVDKIPETARVKSWPTKEVCGWILIWHHAEGLEPTWSIPVVEEIENNVWVYRGRTEHYINAHIEEIPENGADVVHLKQVHGPILIGGTDLRTMWNKRWAFAEHQWTAAWEKLPEPEGHIGLVKLTHDISIFGFVIPMLNLKITARQIGPALAYLDIDSFFGKCMFLMTVTPQAPLVQKMVHNIFANRWMPAVIAKFYLLSEALQIERDIMIWNNKQYTGQPLFVKSKEDSLISKHRRWYSQFYSKKEHSSIFQKERLDF